MDISTKSKKEMQYVFIHELVSIVEYWVNLKGVSEKEKCKGVAFSIMNIFDGTSGGFPCAIDLVLNPHPDDKQYCIENDENYIEKGVVINDDLLLHDLLSKYNRHSVLAEV